MKTEAIIGLGWLLPFLLGLSETMLKIPILDNTTYKLYSAVKKGEMRIIDEQVDGYSVLQHLERGEFDKIFFKQWEKKIYEVYFQKHNRIFYIVADKEKGVTDMPFLKTNVEKEIELKRENEPEFKQAWDESRAEYKLIGEMISLRKQKKITQKELAVLTGNKQQVISRIERKESIPTLRAFSRILDALGYELKIVKKESI